MVRLSGPQPAVGTCRSTIAVHVTSPRWLNFLRQASLDRRNVNNVNNLFSTVKEVGIESGAGSRESFSCEGAIGKGKSNNYQKKSYAK
jgi:hypothetical protein